MSGMFLIEVCLMHSFLVADKSNQSTSYAANFGSWYFIFAFARWSLLSKMRIFFMFEVVDKTDNDFDTADNDDNFGSWYFIFVFARWSSLSNTSLFLMFELVDETDGDFDTADNDNGDDAEKKSVDDRDDTIEGVETNGDVSANNEPTAADTFLVFFGDVNANLPTITFSRGGLYPQLQRSP
jgi:hypothetical protein